MARTLTINGTTMTDGILLSVNYGYATVTNYNDWLRGSLNPLYYGQDTTYTTATYTILVEGESKEEVENKSSALVQSFKKALVMDSMTDFGIDGFLVSADNQDITGKARTIDIQFQGIKQGVRKTETHTFTLNQAWSVEIQGNSATPAVFTFTLDMGYTAMTITINGEDFVVNNISSSATTLTIDSEKGTIDVDGTNWIENYDNWTFPNLIGGTNTIKITGGAPTLKIEYNGRWA